MGFNERCGSISEIEVDSKILKNNQDMADSFNDYFANFGLAKYNSVPSAII